MVWTTTTGVGHSRSDDSFEAGREAAMAAQAEAGDGPVVFTIVYATVLHDQERMLAGVRSVISEGVLVGASTQGISTRGAVDEVDRVVGVAVVQSSSIRARSAVVTGLGRDARAAGEQLAEAIGPPPAIPPLLWYDPVTGANVQALLDALAAYGVGGKTTSGYGRLERCAPRAARSTRSEAVEEGSSPPRRTEPQPGPVLAEFLEWLEGHQARKTGAKDLFPQIRDDWFGRLMPLPSHERRHAGKRIRQVIKHKKLKAVARELTDRLEGEQG
ncbi:MAG: hypothetical protein KDK70_33465 [Myxococcales bacterium]|nr:hypothetical protein [Myxococcales bacterium]